MCSGTARCSSVISSASSTSSDDDITGTGGADAGPKGSTAAASSPPGDDAPTPRGTRSTTDALGRCLWEAFFLREPMVSLQALCYGPHATTRR